MNKVIVKQGQSLLDLAIRYVGVPSAYIEIANLNGLDITSVLEPGKELLIPEPVNKKVISVFSSKNEPATDYLNYSVVGPNQLEGIGYWIINKNFKVS